MSLVTHLECARCGKLHEPGRVYNLCSCGAPLLVRYDLRRAAETLVLGRMASREPTLWRYREVLPLTQDSSILCLGEGFTPLIRAAKARQGARPQIDVSDDRVSIAEASAPRAKADVWLVRYDPRVVQVPIRRGENGGRTLPHRNVVYALVKLGSWSGPAATFAIKPPSDPNLRTAVLIQEGPGGVILSAAKG